MLLKLEYCDTVKIKNKKVQPKSHRERVCRKRDNLDTSYDPQSNIQQ